MKRVRFDLCKAGYCKHPEIMTMKGGSVRSCQFPSLFGFVHHPDEGILLYDTGYHPLYSAQASRWPEGLYPRFLPAFLNEGESALEQIRRKGFSASDVNGIVISHFHGDHVAGLRDFPNARLWCLRSAYQAVSGRSSWANLRNGFLPELLPADFGSRVRWIEDSTTCDSRWGLPFKSFDLFGDGSLQLVELPGHAHGQIGLALEDDAKGPCLLVADAAWSRRAIRECRPPSRLAMAVMHSGPTYRRTLRELHEFARKQPDVRVIPSHCRETFREWTGATS